MKATTLKEAWSLANEIFPTDYAKNERASERGGYDIYESTLEGCNAWISDLGNRLEINLDNGKTINIWIEAEEAPETTESTPESKSPTEDEKKPTERRETTITIESTTTATTASETHTTTRAARLTLSPETTLKDIAFFEGDARRLIKAARAAANRGEVVAVSLSKASYRFFSTCADLKQERFELWTGEGAAITADGVHLTPSEKYNDDPAHDMWITGARGEIFYEITV